MKYLTIILLACLMNTPAKAGDFLEDQWFWVVGAVPLEGTLPTDSIGLGGERFHRESRAIAARFSDQCGQRVDVYLTNLVINEITPWTPNYWFAYVTMEDNKDAAIPRDQSNSCVKNGYLKKGSIGIPTRMYHCASPDTFAKDMDMTKQAVRQYCAGY